MDNIDSQNVPVSLNRAHWEAIRKVVDAVSAGRDQAWSEWSGFVTRTIQSALDIAAQTAANAPVVVAFPKAHWESLLMVIKESCANKDEDWRAWGEVIQRSIGAAITSAPTTRFSFSNIWYLPRERVVGDGMLQAFDDTGTLAIDPTGLVFQSARYRVLIPRGNILFISYGKQGRDFVNGWVKIAYVAGGQGQRAYFKEGGGLGWGGVLGGTQKLVDTLLGLGYNISPVDRSLAEVIAEINRGLQ